MIKRLKDLIELRGGYGVKIGFVHDWPYSENIVKSWDLVMRYVAFELNGVLDAYRKSREHVVGHRGILRTRSRAF